MPQVQAATKQAAIEPLDPKAGMIEMVQVVENKKRNLEKRKQKLEALNSKPDAELTEQQKEAISHIGEVNGNIQYVEEILVRFREVQLQVDKWCAIEAKKEKLANQRNKKSAGKKNGEAAPTQREEPATNDVHHEVSADATPPSRGSVCETPLVTCVNDNESAAQSVPANATGSFAKNATSGDASITTTAATDMVAQSVNDELAHADAALPQREDGPLDEDGAAPKETVTFVNSQAGPGANAHGHADGERAHSGAGGRPYHSGPRRDYRQYYDGPGPRGGYNYGPQSGRPPRRGGRGPYRGGPRGAPRGAPPSANMNSAPPAAANS